MEYQELLEIERANGGNCRACVDCNGMACRGECPGVGGFGNGDSFVNNRLAVKKYKIVMDVINGSTTVDPSTDLFGYHLSTPILVAPISGIKFNYDIDMSEHDYFLEMIEACRQLKTLAFGGDGIQLDFFQSPLEQIDAHDGYGVPTMKPWVNEGIDLRMKLMQKKKFAALAMDVDSAGLPALAHAAIPVECKSVDQLKKIKQTLGNVPFILKGIMSAGAALKAVEAGADGIIISNHGGRVVEDSAGSMDVVETIVSAVKGKLTILIDGGFRSGADVFKALALGCDGVLIGRPFTLACATAKRDGVITLYNHYKDELVHTMKMCGCGSIKDIRKDHVIKVG